MKHSPSKLSSSAPSASIWTSIAGLFLFGIGMGCAGVKNVSSDGAGGHGVTQTGAGGRGVVVAVHCTGPNGLCTDFPTTPLVDPGAATNICSSPSGAGPCIVEPEDGTLFPNNWLRPRVSVQGGTGPMKITVHSDKEANDLVAYSIGNNWKMPKDIWAALASHVQGSDITVTVCGTSGGNSTTKFRIADVGASGSMVFWAANPSLADIDQHMCQPPNPLTKCASAAQLLGFSVGDESTEQVLSISEVTQQSRTDSGNTAPVTCIGCHSATPDKGFVTFADSYPWRTATASVQGATATPSPSGVSFPTVTASGLAALLQPGWGPFSFSLNKADVNPYWQPGMRIGVGSLGLKDPLTPDYSNIPDQNDSPHLAWFNLEAAPRTPMNSDQGNWSYASYAPGAGIASGNALGFIQHNGDLCGGVPCGAGMPSWSHDGSKIVYVSTNAALSGRFNREVANPGPMTDPTTNATQANSNSARAGGMTNLYSVPFNGGLGGDATPVGGAATPDFEEFYPALSPDDSFVAFTRVPAAQTMYANPNAELFVVPTAGGTPTRLAANSPPACTGKSSPGVNNHWPKFSPDVAQGEAGKYYWIIFSSNRADIPPGTSSTGRTIKMSQLYLAPILIGETSFNSFPAIYLWNQPSDSVNTTPAWETFEIPIIP